MTTSQFCYQREMGANPQLSSVHARTTQTWVSDKCELDGSAARRRIWIRPKQGDRTVMVAALGKNTESGRALAEWTSVEKPGTGNLAH